MSAVTCMTRPRTFRVLQLLHDDQGPFRQLAVQYCQLFRGSGDSIQVTTVFLRGEAPPDTSAYGDEVYFLRRPGKSLRGIKPGLLFWLGRLCRRQRFDLVIGHRYKSAWLLGLVSRLVRIPLLFCVVHEHGMLKRRRRRLYIQRLCPNIHLIAVSESVRTDLLAFCPELSARVLQLPNAIDLDSRRLAPHQARTRLGLPETSILVGSAGRLVHKKSWPLLLTAFAECLAELPELPLHLVLTGDGPLRSQLQARVRELNIGSQVTFTGWLDEAEMLMPALDVFVLPSGSSEAFGRVLLEAMAASVPVICSDAAGPAGVVGEAGWLFREADAGSLAACLALVLKEVAGGDSEELAKRTALAGERLAGYFSFAAVRREFRNWPLVQAVLPFADSGQQSAQSR